MSDGASADSGSPLILTPDQRLRVFVSSTLRELAEERAALRDAIAHLSLAPVMFEIGARPHPPRALYRSYLEQSHVFVGVYWESYGWVAPDESVSGLEDEYRLSDRLPRLLYVKEPAPERDPKLTALLERVQADDVASYRRFQTTEELAQLVTDDLMLLLSERFRAATERPSGADPRELKFTPPPQPLTPILGRDQELDALRGLVGSGARLITVTGAGGIGKSRLVIEAARTCKAEPPLDVHLVDLTPVASPDSVPAEIAKSLGLPVEGTRGATESLIDHLAEHRLLLVADNFEHVAAAGVALLELISACPGLQLLIASRHLLRLRGETEFALAPLPVPPAGAPPELVCANPTVQLFVQRAQAAQPAFQLTAENLPPVAEICRRLDGLPLAVELAAARVRLLSPDQLLERLGTRLDLLSSGAADLPERQRTMQSAIDWSYNLLSTGEQELFSQLAVFVDGWSLPAAEAVCAIADGTALDSLVSLLEKSLVVVGGPAQAGEPRMRMLAPVHEYAEQKLAAGGRKRELQQRHADYFGDLVEQHESELRGAGQDAWSRRLITEEGNLRTAMNWWLESSDGEAVVRFLWATNIHYWLTGSVQEFNGWARAAEPLVEGMSRLTRGRLRIVYGYGALDFLGVDEGARAFEEALALLEGTGDNSAVLLARTLLSQVMGLRGEPSAPSALKEVLDDPSLPDDPWLFAMAHWVAGGFAMMAGDMERTEFHNGQVVARGRELGNWLFVGIGLERLAFVHLRGGATEAASSALRESVDCLRRVHYREGLAYDLQGLAHLLAANGDAPAAAEALAAAGAARSVISHAGPIGVWSLYEPDFDALREQLKAVLGDRFSDAWVGGRGRDVYTAADAALSAIKQAK